MTVFRPNLGPHFGRANNPQTFGAAYAYAFGAPGHLYATVAGKPFTVQATVVGKGLHKGAQVLRFISDGVERARAYQCCWDHRTNCNRQHIDVYTEVL
jgi:hypothetical protein